MSSTAIGIISGAGVILSVALSLLTVGIGWGSLKTKVQVLETQLAQVRNTAVTKEDLVSALSPLRETLSEIRGMFRLELKDG